MASNDYSNGHLEINRLSRRQEALTLYRQLKNLALTLYRQLKNLNQSELGLDDELFVENFEAAMHFMWGFGRKAITQHSSNCLSDVTFENALSKITGINV
jgi:hypothetical protein